MTETSATAAIPEPALEPIGEVLGDLQTQPVGLTSREAERRLTQYGRNEVTRRQGPGRVAELARQFAHPLALLLWAAAALAMLAGNPTLAGAIVAVIVLNALLAFLQEVQAERATEALSELLPPQVRVRRDDSPRLFQARGTASRSR